MGKHLLSIISVCLFSQFLFPQVHIKKSFADQKQKIIISDNKPGHLYSSFVYKDSVIVSDIDMTKMIDVIVEFKDEPLLIQMQKSGLQKINMNAFQARQTQLSNALTRLHATAEKVYNTTFERPQKTREFYKLFNGAAMKIPRALLSDIASLDFVKIVYPSKTYSINQIESNHLTGVDSVWTKYGNRGDSIVVGIIDSGIDYLHPALGGGFGEGYKVIGGYDFVNNDSDPMDDNNHGTHVAGIVAGNNYSITGVAPNALLMAFKVLDKNGRGEDATVLAGIERALDPNDDNNFDDKVDIVNMSLGGDGDPNDPVSTAVNNAVSLGVIFCVAAGNSSSYGSISSPGMAENAITVGASDDFDKLASFTSKGPNPENFAIKPDVVAPGVGVYSSIPGGGYQKFSGTSMSAPVVAGVCALLKRQYKDWSPQMVKSAIMTSTKDLGADVMAQGAGRVQALKAFSVSSFAFPASISFGINNIYENLWSKFDTVTILNKHTSSQVYNVKVTGIVPGFTITASTQNFSLLPGESKQIVLSLVVNNNLVSEVTQPPYSYYGYVRVEGSKDILNLPWSFTKLSCLTLNFDRPVLSCKVFNKYNYFAVSDTAESYNLYNVKLRVPSGKYIIWTDFTKLNDIVADKGEIILVIKDSVDVKGYREININSTEAVNEIKFNGVDESGRLMSSGNNAFNNMIIANGNPDYDSGFNLEFLFSSIFMQSGKISVKCSHLSKNFIIKAGQFQSALNTEHTARAIQYPIANGLNDNLSLTNNPADFLKQNVRISLSPLKKETNAFFQNIIQGGNVAVSKRIVGDLITTSTWTGQVFLTRETDKMFVSSVGIGTDTAVQISSYGSTFAAGILRSSGDSIGCFDIFSDADKNYMYPQNSLLQFGNGVIVPNISLYKNEYGMSLFSYYKGQLNENRGADNLYSTCEIYDPGNKLIFADSISKLKELSLASGKYNFVMRNNNYFINGIHGDVTLSSNFLINADSWVNPPVLNSLRILNSKNIPVSKLEIGEKGKVAFSISTGWGNITGISASIKKHESANWKTLDIVDHPTTNIYNILKIADIGNITDNEPGKIDLKILFYNSSELKYELILEPAFILGNYVENDSTEAARLPKQFALHNNYPNPFNPATMIRYELPKQTRVEIKVFDLLGREISTLVNQVQKAGIYNTSFYSTGLSSGVYFYVLKADGYTSSKKMLLIK